MTREKVNVLYYPDMYVSDITLKKAILLFDELHFIDRPSFTFDNNFGSIGATSPLRQYEESFREAGIPLYVHSVQGGRIKGDLLEQVRSDVHDLNFIKKFKEGLVASSIFRDQYIPTGNYGKAGTEKEIIEKISTINPAEILSGTEMIDNLIFDEKIKPYELSSPEGCAKQLLLLAMLCSTKLNFALIEGVKHGFSPLADIATYSNLLEARYLRAMSKLESKKNKIQPTDLSFAIFDELITTESVEKLSMEQVVKYRKDSANAREEFLEYLSVLQEKQGSISVEGDYAEEITKLVKKEIIPAAKIFKKKLQTIDESFFGSLAKGTLGWIGGAHCISIFGDLSWEKILYLSGATGAHILSAAVDRFLAQRATKRECSISYLLTLEDKY